MEEDAPQYIDALFDVEPLGFDRIQTDVPFVGDQDVA